MSDYNLGEFEELVLLAICAVPDDTYSVPIQQHIETVAGRATSFGAVHRVLVRLENKDMVASRMGDVTRAQGGKRKRLYNVTGAGKAALYETWRMRERMWAAISVTSSERIA